MANSFLVYIHYTKSWMKAYQRDFAYQISQMREHQALWASTLPNILCYCATQHILRDGILNDVCLLTTTYLFLKKSLNIFESHLDSFWMNREKSSKNICIFLYGVFQTLKHWLPCSKINSNTFLKCIMWFQTDDLKIDSQNRD